MTKFKWTKYLLVIPFAYFFMMFANALVSILTLYMPENMVGTYDNTKEILNNSSYFMLIITTAIIAPISEEFMHRGVVYNRFKRICPPVLAAIISSIIFGNNSYEFCARSVCVFSWPCGGLCL